MAPSLNAQRFVNKWGARLIPLVLAGLVGYATWVVISLVAVHYLLNPPSPASPRTGAAIVVIVLYFLLMLPMSAAYLRTLYLVATDPGYVPKPKTSSRKRSRHADQEKISPRSDEDPVTPSDYVGYLDRGALYAGRISPPAGLDQFYMRDIFESEIDGLPRWCSACKAWKPDRSHHSSEVGRCVFKLDHFCPWAGGIVSETSFKPFIQFCLYGGLYCIFVLIVVAIFTAEQHRVLALYDINWIVVIILSGLFSIFTTGMGLNSIHAVFVNSTTVDNLTRRTKIYHFCVLLPPPTTGPTPDNPTQAGSNSNRAFQAGRFPTITYPLPEPDAPMDGSNSSVPPRTFAILATPTGSNPYLLSSRLENFKTVMGDHVWDWILPVGRSPCCSHSQEDDRFGTVMYKLGPVLEGVMRDAGLAPCTSVDNGSENRRRKRGGNAGSRRDQHERPRETRQVQAPTEQHDPPGSVTMSRLEEGWGQGAVA